MSSQVYSGQPPVLRKLPALPYLMLQVSLVLAILVHIEGGQGGRPTFFQLAVFALAGSLLFNASFPPASRLSLRLNKLLVILSITVITSLIVNPLGSEQVTNLNADVIAGGSYGKVLILSLFSLLACGVAYISGYKIQGESRLIARLIGIIVAAASINSLAVIATWFIQTGGVFDRYNFVLPLFKSYGLSATMSYTGLIFIFPLWRIERSGVMRFIFTIAALLCLLSTLVIFSRQTTLSLVAVLVLHVLISSRKIDSSKLRAVAALALLAGVALFIQKTIGVVSFADWYTRLDDFSDFGIYGRENVLYGSYQIFKNNPMFGCGYGFWYAFNTATFAEIEGTAVIVASPHNGLAAVISEGGVFGSVGFLLVNLAALRVCWRATVTSTEPFLIETTSVIFSLLILHAVSQTISNSLILPPSGEASTVQYAFIIWLIVGIAAGIESKRETTPGFEKRAAVNERRPHRRVSVGPSRS